MNLPRFSLLLCVPFFALATGQAQSAKDVTVRATVIALPNAAAAGFAASQDFASKTEEALKSLEKLIAAKQATSVANLAVTTKSGQRAVAEAGKTFLEVEPTVSPDGKAADLNVVVNDNGHKLVTAVQVANAEAKFLGSFPSPTDPALTEYIFVRVSF